MEYIVACTKIYNGTIAVNADSKEEALKKAQDIICENNENVSWEFGESTADYVESVRDNKCNECGKDIGNVEYIRYNGICKECWHKLNKK